MSRQTVLMLLVVLLAACGGGEEKRAFEEYEAAVDPLLLEESRNVERFRELSADAVHFGAGDEVRIFIRKVLVPFYAKLESGVEKIQPKGEKLIAIHDYLLDYVKLRREFLDIFKEMEGLDARTVARTKEMSERILKLGMEVEKKGRKIQPAFEAAPEDGQRILVTLQQIAAMAQDTQKNLGALEAGGIAAAQYLDLVDKKVRPFITGTKKNLKEVSVSEKGRALITAVVSYLEAVEALIEASRPLAEARKEVEKSGAPIQRRLTQKAKDAEDTFDTYREEARKYRDSLR